MNNVEKGERWGIVCDYILMLLAYVGRFDSVDTTNAVATNEADRRMIFANIKKTIGFETVNAVVREGIRNAAEVALKRGLEKFNIRGLTDNELFDWSTLIRKMGMNWFITADGLLDPGSLEFQLVFDAIKSSFWDSVKTAKERKEIHHSCSEVFQQSVIPSEQFISTGKSPEVSNLFRIVSELQDATSLETIMSIRRIIFILERFFSPSQTDSSQTDSSLGDQFPFESDIRLLRYISWV
jgi:hypothetical protein